MITLSKEDTKLSLISYYNEIRKRTEAICKPLSIEDYVVQPIVDVSPPKWHLGHSTWFFETFVLKQFSKDYKEFDPNFNFVFNSYYETIGARVMRTDRGNLSRPTVEDIYSYRKYVDEKMQDYLKSPHQNSIGLVVLGLNHEQQHQELLLTDIKFILGHNPLFPRYSDTSIDHIEKREKQNFIDIKGGTYDIGFNGEGFCYDNELNRHSVFLNDFSIASRPVVNGEYLEFIEDGGYKDFRYWHAEGWEWVKNHGINAPLYWHQIDGSWQHYCLNGLRKIDPEEITFHVSFYEASAFAAWKKMRLPTEFEWEAASSHFNWGECWEWTGSAYLPYPGYKKAAGAIGEYNGKFMVNQMVLRGASIATPPAHSRSSYRNFFHPHLRWQFTGIRLCQDQS